jgi:hypothetical protein
VAALSRVRSYVVGERIELKLAWWKRPLDLQDDHVRRLFAKEFVMELRRVGAATTQEMRDADVSLLKVPAENDELAQVAEVTRRMGWVEPRQRTAEGGSTEQEWALTETGLAVPPPASLELKQVFTRVLRFADPSRTRGAADWLPLAALVAGTVAATGAQQSGNKQTLIAIRALSIAVLFLALVGGLIGEAYLVRAAKAFRRLQKCGFYEPIKAFQSWRHLRWLAAFDAAVLTAFGLGIFLKWQWSLVALVVAVLVGIVIMHRFRRPWREVRRTRPP